MSEKVLVTPAELSGMMNSEPIVLIDTRDPASYAAGHLPDAVNIPRGVLELRAETVVTRLLSARGRVTGVETYDKRSGRSDVVAAEA